uniref:BTB/POZ domain-containing protein 9-like n=1 Tax=Styela clava TaxID=7725 RepID=UPI00193A9E17|nr:BTB/POZ domain-containing protein 9-like [Styela clava]
MSVSMCDSLVEDKTLSESGEVDHCKVLSEDIGGLVLNQDYSDVTFVVGGKCFSAHRVILAARCKYFRALLFGGMREAQPEARIPVDDTTPEAFGLLLQYIYTAKLQLAELTEECMLEVLALSNKYGFSALEKSISNFLLKTISIGNACEIYEVATLYSLDDLKEAAAEFIDRNAVDILNNDAFLTLSLEAVTSIIKRDSFCASERAIFKAVEAWWEQNDLPSETEIEKTKKETLRKELLGGVRLSLMSIQELLHTVRPSGLICPNTILDAIERQSEQNNVDLNYRGVLCPEENIATMQHGAQVIKGEMCAALLDGDSTNYDMERGFSRHSIDDAVAGSKQEAGIVVKLGRPCIINHIRMLLWDKDMRSYSYYIEVSMNDVDWVRVVDYSTYHCRSWQSLYFRRRVVRYIRIVGTHNTANKVFHVVSLEAMFTRSTEIMEDGIIVPQSNVATASKCATVIEGVSRDRNALLNGEVVNYDWDSGYTCHQLGNGGIVIQLSQPYQISTMRMLLWDIDDRCYGYYVDISTNQKKWKRIIDNTKKECRSWQSLVIPRQPVVFIRIIGTNNTANEVFHCVHFECPDTTISVSLPDANENKVDGAEDGDISAFADLAILQNSGEDFEFADAETKSPNQIEIPDDYNRTQRFQNNNPSGEGRRTMRHSRGSLFNQNSQSKT